MSYTLDYFVGNLKCPVCGTISDANDKTNITTYIRDNKANLEYLGKGDILEIPFNDINDLGYRTIAIPDKNSEIRILETWECPTCGTPFNWALVKVKDSVIESIENVLLDRSIFLSAHYITNECISVAKELSGKSFEVLNHADIIQIIKDLIR